MRLSGDCPGMGSLIDLPEVFSSIKDRMENVIVKSRLKARLLHDLSGIACQRQSVRADQAAGLLRSQVPGHVGADVVLEAADGRTGQRTKDAVLVPFVVVQAVQYVLDSQPIRFGHTGLVGHGRHRRG